MKFNIKYYLSVLLGYLLKNTLHYMNILTENYYIGTTYKFYVIKKHH